MTKRIQNAIDIFLDAINNGTLAKGSCTMCAVGNLCRGNPIWSNLFCTYDGVQIKLHISDSQFLEEARRVISYTEFTEEELAQIEFAFETNTNINYLEYCLYTKEAIRKDQIKGLEAVVKVMLSFENDEVTDVKEVFSEKAKMIPIN